MYTNTTYSFPRVKIVSHCSTKKESILRNDGQSRSKTKKRDFRRLVPLLQTWTKMAKPALKPEDSRSLPRVLGLTQGLLSQIP